MNKRPFVTISVCWTIGSVFTLMNMWIELIVVGLFILMLLLIRPKSRVVYVGAFLAILLSTGWCLLYDHLQQSQLVSEWDDHVDSVIVTAIGQISSPLKIDGDRVSFALKTEQTLFHDQATVFTRRERMQVMLTLRSESEQLAVAQQLRRGMNIALTGKLERPAMATNFGAFDYRQYLYWQRIHWIVRVDGFSAVELSDDQTGSLMRSWTRALGHVDRFRVGWGKKMDELFPSEQSGWLKSMTIGLRDELDPETFTQFSLIGMSHILAISGLHVGIFVGAMLGILKSMRLSRETNLVVVIALIPLYILITGAAPSVVRAGLMAMFGLYALRRGWLKDGLNLVCGTGVLMLMFNPYYLFQISFQLSFIVTIGLIVFVPHWNRMFPLKPAWLRNTLAVTFVAQIISFPVTAYYFSHLSLLSWLANLVLVPILSMIVFPLALCAVGLGTVYIPVGAWLAQLLSPLNEAITTAITYLNSWQAGHLLWKAPSVLWIMAYYVFFYGMITQIVRYKLAYAVDAPPIDRRGVFGLSMMKRAVPLPRVQLWIGVLSAAFLAMLIIYGYTSEMWHRYGEVHYIDVGQGDAILVRTPNNQTMLIDTGGTLRYLADDEAWKSRLDPFEVGKDVVVPLLKKRGIQQLDYVVLTHQHYDHIGGLLAVLESIPIKQIIFNGTVNDNEFIRERFSEAITRNIPILVAEAGKTLQLDRYTDITILYPKPLRNESETTDQALSVLASEHQNDQSVVFWMQMHDTTFLFTGDLYETGEREIIRMLTDDHLLEDNQEMIQQSLPIDVLKVAHHGSKTSSSAEWLDFWQPTVSVISAGRRNFYGHPHTDVLERLEYFESDIYRTDLHGEVQLRVYPSQLQLQTMLD